ncbi:MAG: hypothetical protein P4L49_05285 [Desulfosporosinus sp.]|nr:hypothetical protein [Desulfosporosinus sp.]
MSELLSIIVEFSKIIKCPGTCPERGPSGVVPASMRIQPGTIPKLSDPSFITVEALVTQHSPHK